MATATGTAADRTLDELLQEVDKSRGAIETRTKNVAAQTRRFEELQEQLAGVGKIADKQQRDLQTRILQASLEQLREETEQERTDLAEAVYGLNMMLEKMGGEFAGLNVLNAQEQALVDSAKQELADAQAELEVAKGKWSWFGIRARAVLRANGRITTATPRIAEAEQEAQKRMRQRLLKADMRESFQEFNLRVQRTIDIMVERRAQVIKQFEITKVAKDEKLQEKTKAARAIEQFDTQLDGMNADLRQAEEQLSHLENGSEEYSAQERKISNMKADIEETNGKRNAALVVFEHATNFSKQFEIHEQAQIKLRDNLLMWITALKKDTSTRLKTFESRLELMKAGTSQEAAQKLDQMGAELDLRTTETVAAIGAAADRARTKRFEEMPDRIKGVESIAIAQVKAHLEVDARMKKVYEDYKERWGIDPLATSFFNEANAPTGGGSASAS